MVERFVNSLARGQFDPTLRVKRVQGTRDVWESAGRLTAEPPSHTDPKVGQVASWCGGPEEEPESHLAIRDRPCASWLTRRTASF